MTGSGETYRQYIPELALSIEKNTENVPQDGKHYVLHDGQIQKGFRSLKKAQEAFKELVAKAGYVPKPQERRVRSEVEQNIEAYLDNVDLYWAESHKYRARGGKGGRGGV